MDGDVDIVLALRIVETRKRVGSDRSQIEAPFYIVCFHISFFHRVMNRMSTKFRMYLGSSNYSHTYLILISIQ